MGRSILYLLLRHVLGLFRSDQCMAAEVELENVVLRHQLAILRRQVKRPVYRTSDRAFLAAASGLLRREAWGAFLVRVEAVAQSHSLDRGATFDLAGSLRFGVRSVDGPLGVQVLGFTFPSVATA